MVLRKEPKTPDVDIIWPTVLALRKIGRPAAAQEINQFVVELGNFTEAQKKCQCKDGSSFIGYRAQWMRSYLKTMKAATENDGFWKLTDKGHSMSEQECLENFRIIDDLYRRSIPNKSSYFTGKGD